MNNRKAGHKETGVNWMVNRCRMKLVSAMLFVALAAVASHAEQCKAVTQEGARCTRTTEGETGYCWQHSLQAASRDSATADPIDDFPEMNMQLITEAHRVLDVTNGVYLILDGAQKARLAGVVAINRANAMVKEYCGTNVVTIEYDHVETGRHYGDSLRP